MDKVFIQGLVQLQCKRFTERGEERISRREGGREREREREIRAEGEKEKGRHTQPLYLVILLQTQACQENAGCVKDGWGGE